MYDAITESAPHTSSHGACLRIPTQKGRTVMQMTNKTQSQTIGTALLSDLICVLLLIALVLCVGYLLNLWVEHGFGNLFDLWV